MPPAHPSRLLLLIISLLAGTARADVGATLSVQTDARDRGLSYSAEKPGAQLGASWDGEGGWYAGASLTRARFVDESGASLRAYGGRVLALGTGLDGEIGLVVYRFENVSHYDFVEAYAGLLAERWNLRLFASPDYYGVGQRSLYGEVNVNWPLGRNIAAIGHVGVLRGWGGRRWTYGEAHGPVRIDLRAGLSWQVGASSEVQLVGVSVSRGGPYTWTDAMRRRTVTLSFTTAF